MDPFSRKLFRNSGARQRLAQMGGIVASSPELASTVQRFQTGGFVGAEPTILPHTGPGMGVRHASGVSGPFALAGTPPTPAEAVGTPPTPAEVVGLADGTETAPATIMGPEDRARMERARSLFPSLDMPPEEDRALIEEGLRLRQERAAAQTRARAEQLRRDAQTAASMGDPETAQELAAEADALAAAARAAERETLSDVTFGTPLEFDDIGDLLPPPPVRGEPDPDPEPAPTAEPDAEPTRDPMAAAADDTAAELRRTLGLEEPDSPPRNRRERINQELDLIREVFGHRNRDEARERAMNLAMIGLAIAAGQSPNALTNIAQGALAGTQAMQRAQEAEREREDALRLRAYESVLTEEREERQFGRQMQLAEFRAGLAPPAGAGTTTPTDPGNLFATELNRVLGAGIETPVGMRLMEIEDEREREAFALETALNNVLTVSPTATDADRARLEEVARRVQARISRLRGSDVDSLTPAQSATLTAARQALETNPANRAAIESRLRAVGIDPALL